MGSTLTDLQAAMTWEHSKCLVWYSPQSHFWDCNITLNLLGDLGVWSGDRVYVIIKVWLCMSNSFTMCALHYCWLLFITSKTTPEYCVPEFIIARVCRPLLAKSCAVLKYVSSTNDDIDKCVVFFNMELTDSDKLVVICPQRFPSSKHCTHFYLGNWSSHSAALALFAWISPTCRQCIFSIYA